MSDDTRQAIDGLPEVQPPGPSNRALLEQVHPSDWAAPTPAGRYNLVVLGGGTAGLVTLADVLEELVGEIQDEFEEGEESVREVDAGLFEIQAGLHVSEVNEALGLEIPEEEAYETLGGFVLAGLALCLIAILKVQAIDYFYYRIAFGVYGLVVTSYILSRFLIAAFYRPPVDVGYRPTIPTWRRCYKN